MTNRFAMKELFGEYRYYDNFCGIEDKLLTAKQVLNYLNQFNNTINSLSQTIDENGKLYARLEKENEQLKLQVKFYKVDGFETLIRLQRTEDNNQKALKRIEQLSEENKQLKKNCKNYEWYKQYKRLLNENEQLESELEEVVEVCRKYGIYKEELQYVLADYDKMLNENGERAIRYKYCVNSR